MHGSDEGSQHMVSMRNKKYYPSGIIKYSLLSIAKVGCSGPDGREILSEPKRDFIYCIVEPFFILI